MASPIDVVQSRLGVPRSGHWDRTTDGAILAYQSSGKGQYPMRATGHPDPGTLANLGYFDPKEMLPERWANYLGGGEKPGTFGRDVRTAIDQVPRWAWGTVAAAFSVFAIMAYRTDRKREKGGR